MTAYCSSFRSISIRKLYRSPCCFASLSGSASLPIRAIGGKPMIKGKFSRLLSAAALLVGMSGGVMPASAQTAAKPNILVIMGDDIGLWNISAYNRGMMGYRTPNIDRIARDGAIFTDYYGQQSCTAGRAAFITGQSTIRTDPPKG